VSTGFQEKYRAAQAWWVAVTLLAGGFVVCAYHMLRQAVAPSWQDTEAYLGHSLYVAEHGGLLGFLRESFSGTFPITERHPLYLLVLAPFASRTAEFFWIAKVVDLVTGLIALLTLIWMVARRYGRGPAVIAGILYALSSSLLIASSHVNHEALFTIFTLWTWWFLTEDSYNDARAPIDVRERLATLPTVARWAIAGAFLGFAYLVKSPASLIGVAIVAAGLWYVRLRFVFNARVWVLLLATAIVSSPLLVRNLIGFGTPVYEGVNSNIMWIDAWSDIGGETSVMHYDRYGIMTVDKNGLPTARDYLQTHSTRQIAKRVLKGLYTEIFVVAPKALAPPFPQLSGVATAWGFVLLAFAVAGWWLRRDSWDATFVFFWSGAFLLFFGWDRMFPDIRYLAPLVPVWIAFASYALWMLALQFWKPRAVWRLATGGVSVVMLLVAGSTIALGGLTKPHPVVHESRSYAQLRAWFNGHIEEGDRVLLGPTREFYGLIWMVDRPVSVIQTPSSDSLGSFQRYLRERDVRYLVLNTENAYGLGGRLRSDMTPFVEVTADGSIVEKQPLPGWRRVLADPSTPRRFIIYESELVAQRKKGAGEPEDAHLLAAQTPTQ
jgi:4-amino-4-deoxy-L-arabinose transferase-like glycosyltransferase